MIRKIEAVIFDMDGVIIDSEDMWKQAEKEVFTAVGVELSDELCCITECMTTAEVTKFWFDRFPWQHKSLADVEREVVERVAFLISEKGKGIEGVERLIQELKNRRYKIGLATNSPAVLIQVVLSKLRLERYIDAVASAEHELQGKPNPNVYLTVAKKLNLDPGVCIAVEDSYPGLCAAKNAGMKTIVVRSDLNGKPDFDCADFKINDFSAFDFSFLN
jgi:sugar-phosphatase